MAHGTHQNQYTKRRALLNSISNNASSNNDSDDNAGSSEEGSHRDCQRGHFAETGFAAEASGQPQDGEQDQEGAQNADSRKAEDAVPVGESGVLSRQQVDESSGRHKGSSDESKKGQRRRKHKPRNADASSAENATCMETDAPTDSTQPLGRKDSSALTDRRVGNIKASVNTEVAAHVVTDALPSRKSGEADERQVSGAGQSMGMRDDAPGAAVDQSAKVSKDADSAMQPVTDPSKDSKVDADNVEAATSSGSHTWHKRLSLFFSLVFGICTVQHYTSFCKAHLEMFIRSKPKLSVPLAWSLRIRVSYPPIHPNHSSQLATVSHIIAVACPLSK